MSIRTECTDDSVDVREDMEDGDSLLSPMDQDASAFYQGSTESDEGDNDSDSGAWFFVHKYGIRSTRNGNPRIQCLVSNCHRHIASKYSSTSRFTRHLASHGIKKDVGPHIKSGEKRNGPLDMFVQGKRARTFQVEEFQRLFVKFLVSSKLPFTTCENAALQELLEMARIAPTASAVQLPSTSTCTRKVSNNHTCVCQIKYLP